ncbi:hypothetical protein KEM63_16100 [Halopseudomonas nanhaiensis]|uniref:hypothetical protein n=1 Tax=Halopseudomonas nanhaiensis TaxID=2830842 RepID=UPI001CBB573F|nr:hypothetical protein [Halopseudomonas nanhaiensis]UAW98267.1 hypothetical protein KEM63_16100 [Halopseudomonas nanhaiensis]
MSPRMGVRLVTIFSAVVLAFFLLGDWLAQRDAPRQMVWYETYRESLWQPLHERSLTLAQADETLGRGHLWMISADGEPALVSRYNLESEERLWQAQAVIGLGAAEMDSLVEAQAWEPGIADQPVAPAVGEALADREILRMSMIPVEPLDLQSIEGTFGGAEVRMPVSDGEAWVYPRIGAVVAVGEDEAYSIMFGLRDDS